MRNGTRENECGDKIRKKRASTRVKKRSKNDKKSTGEFHSKWVKCARRKTKPYTG